MTTYKIVRHYMDYDLQSKIIVEGLSLQEAQAYCRNPNSSSQTCDPALNEDPTEDWFDGYRSEE